MINSLFAITLTQAKMDWLMARLFEKDLPTPWTASMPVPFSSENPPLVVRVSAFFDALYLHCLINMFYL
jgi:hypothetical protein